MTDILTLTWPCNEETHKGRSLGHNLYLRYKNKILGMYVSRRRRWITKKDVVGGARTWWIEKP